MANRALIENEIREYCRVNGIKDVAGFITQCILRGFNIFRYGNSPSDNKKRENGEVDDKPVNRKRKKEVAVQDSDLSDNDKVVVTKRKIKIVKND